MNIKFNTYLLNHPEGGIILLGADGTGVFNDAVTLAENIANHGKNTFVRWYDHPDISVIKLEEGKRDIVLEQIQDIKLSHNKIPLYSKTNIYVIDKADRMNTFVQSSLLKILEDGAINNTIILCSSGGLMDTIKNRCIKLTAGRGINEEEALKYANISGVPASIIYACGNRYEWLENMSESHLRDILKMVDSFRLLKDKRELLFSLQALPEKNEDSFVKNYSENEQLSLLYGLESILFDVIRFINNDKLLYIKTENAETLSTLYPIDQIYRIIKQILISRQLIILKKFTNNDYFEFVRYLIDI